MHAPSHWSSCGQTRPHTAGSALVSRTFLAAPRKSPSATRPRNEGMSMLTGHAPRQPGFLHMMQRAASIIAVSGVNPSGTSSKFVIRTAGSCSGIGWRGTRTFGARSARAGRSRGTWTSVSSDTGTAPRSLHRAALLGDVRAEPLAHEVEVDLVAVELGPVDAGELRVAADADAAAAAHPRTVDHDRVEADDGRELVRPCHAGHRLHHRHRPDGEYLVDTTPGGDEVGEHVGDETVPTVRAVVGRHVQLVGHPAGLLLEDEQVMGAGAEDGDHLGARGLERAGDRVEHADADPA